MNNINALLIYNEGLKLRTYDDGKGNTTIGVGRNLTAKGITREEAMLMLRDDRRDAELTVQRVFCDPDAPQDRYATERGTPRYAALVDMAFTLGDRGFRSFRRMIAALRKGDYNTAHDEIMNSKWRQQDPGRARRDAMMVLTNKWQG